MYKKWIYLEYEHIAGQQKKDNPKQKGNSILASPKVVSDLTNNLLKGDKVCVTDNWYTSLQLAHTLLYKKHTALDHYEIIDNGIKLKLRTKS